MYFILASKSPRRREILTDIGLDYKIFTEEVDEDIDLTLPPDTVVKELSKRKALSSCKKLNDENALIISADTVVFCKGRILGKPQDDSDAKKMLMFMSDSTHSVYTGVTVCYQNKVITDCEKSDIVFRKLTEKEIDKYIKTGEHRDKAGSYGIQEKGGYFVKKVDGDVNNIIGLPVNLLREMILNEFDIDIFDASTEVDK